MQLLKCRGDMKNSAAKVRFPHAPLFTHVMIAKL